MPKAKIIKNIMLCLLFLFFMSHKNKTITKDEIENKVGVKMLGPQTIWTPDIAYNFLFGYIIDARNEIEYQSLIEMFFFIKKIVKKGKIKECEIIYLSNNSDISDVKKPFSFPLKYKRDVICDYISKNISDDFLGEKPRIDIIYMRIILKSNTEKSKIFFYNYAKGKWDKYIKEY